MPSPTKVYVVLVYTNEASPEEGACFCGEIYAVFLSKDSAEEYALALGVPRDTFGRVEYVIRENAWAEIDEHEVHA